MARLLPPKPRFLASRKRGSGEQTASVVDMAVVSLIRLGLTEIYAWQLLLTGTRFSPWTRVRCFGQTGMTTTCA